MCQNETLSRFSSSLQKTFREQKHKKAKQVSFGELQKKQLMFLCQFTWGFWLYEVLLVLMIFLKFWVVYSIIRILDTTVLKISSNVPNCLGY